MTQQGVDMGRLKHHFMQTPPEKGKILPLHVNDIQAFEITVPNTATGKYFQQHLFAKLFYHWTHDFTNKIGFDVQKSGFAIENLPTCSSSPDFTLRCVFIMKNIRSDKINILNILITKYQLESFFISHHVKMCTEIKWMSINEKKKLFNTYRFGEDNSECITSSSWTRFRLMKHVLTSWDELLKRCTFDTDDGDDDDDDDGESAATDDDACNKEGKKDEVTISGTVSATVNMDLNISDDDDDDDDDDGDDDDDDGKDGGGGGGSSNDNDDDSGIENDNGGGDAPPSSTVGGGEETSPSATTVAAQSASKSSSMPSSKHEKSNSSSSSSSSPGFKYPSLFKAPIDVPSIPKGKMSKLTIEEINRIEQNMMSTKSMPLRCSDPYLSLMATDCHKDGKCYVHQIEYSDKTRNNHSVMFKQINMVPKTRVGKKRQYVDISKSLLTLSDTSPAEKNDVKKNKVY